MEYGKIIAITGMPGLYEMMNSKGDGAIVRSLDDQSTKFVSGRVHQFTHLESIEVYTQRENVNLVDVLNAMKDSNEKLPDEKDGKALEAYFKKVYPELDFDRVYASDMRKMVKWFNALSKNKVEIKLTEVEEEPEEEPASEPAEELIVEAKPKAQKEKAKEKVTEKESPKPKAAAKAETKAAPKEKKEKEKEVTATKTKAKAAKPKEEKKEKEPAKSKASKAAPKKAASKKK